MEEKNTIGRKIESDYMYAYGVCRNLQRVVVKSRG